MEHRLEKFEKKSLHEKNYQLERLYDSIFLATNPLILEEEDEECLYIRINSNVILYDFPNINDN